MPDSLSFDFSQTADLDDDLVAESVNTEPIMALNSSETALEVVQVPTNGNGKAEPEQVVLFDKGEWWEEYWRGMPEFAQKDLMPWKSIVVHFENRCDMEKFSELVEQSVNLTTKSIWFPAADIGRLADKRYIDAEEAQR